MGFMKLTDKFKLAWKFRDNWELTRALDYIENLAPEIKDEAYLVEVAPELIFKQRIVEVTVDFRLNRMYFKGKEIDVRDLHSDCTSRPEPAIAL